MRVIAGAQRGRRLMGPKGPGLRPTADRVKEALFSILSPRLAGARVLDLYAGTGAIGIEALSRGARHATFVEPHASSLKVLRANLELCGLSTQATIHPCTAETFFKRRTAAEPAYDIIFADPPYDDEGASALLSAFSRHANLQPTATLVLEHGSKTEPVVDGLALIRRYRYGDTTLSLFRSRQEESPAP